MGEKQKTNVHLEMRQLKQNRASGTEEQRKERLKIEPKNYKRKRKGHHSVQNKTFSLLDICPTKSNFDWTLS